MWTWFSKLGSPKWFYEISSKCLPWLFGFTVITMSIGVTWALLFVSEEYQQGFTNRIFYIHVPVNTISLTCFPLMAIAATITLVWKMKLADMIAKSCAPIGLSFTALGLATGAIWGDPIWGTWWVWDAKLTALLIQLFLFIGIISLRSAITNVYAAAKACALLAILGTINVPIIIYAVNWWNTLHQPASQFSLDNHSANGPGIWIPLVIMFAAIYGFFIICLILNTRNEILKRERRSQWVTDLIMKRYM